MTSVSDKECTECEKSIYSTIYRWVLSALAAFGVCFAFTYSVDVKLSEVSAATRELKKDVEYIRRSSDDQRNSQEKMMDYLEKMQERMQSK